MVREQDISTRRYMIKDITMTFTQDEANALFTAMCVRVNDFKEQMKQAVDGNTDRVLECAKLVNVMESTQMKLVDVGASFWC